MIKKNFYVFFALFLLFVKTSFADVAKPRFDWSNDTYSLVQINQNAQNYEDLIVARHDEVDVSVSWQAANYENIAKVELYLDDQIYFTGKSSDQTIDFKVAKGGKYNMRIRVCDDQENCIFSDDKELIIADTDGSHLEPLAGDFLENHQKYQNTSNKIVGTYFVEWGVYGRKFPVDKIPAANLTHILYGFIPICGGDGINDSLKSISGSFGALQRSCTGRDDFKVTIHDPFAALQKSQKNVENYSDPFKGNFGQLMALKQANPNLKILPSIGGWTLSDPFFLMDDDNKRATFVASVKEFLLTWKFFDGVDIDFEYPGGKGANPNFGKPTDGELYYKIMRDLSLMLDELERETKREYQLTSAIGAGVDKVAVIDYGKVSPYMDYYFLMSYDYFGGWDFNNLGHHSGLYGSDIVGYPDYTTDNGLRALVKSGAPKSKIVLGVSMYGRGWSGITNYTNQNPFTGKASGLIKGTWEDGVLDYRDIADNHTKAPWQYNYDSLAKAPYLFNQSTGELITYDDPKSVIDKGKYILDNDLAGVFSWEIDADNGDILNAMHQGLDHQKLTQSANRAPTARAGSDIILTKDQSLKLDGTNSSDPDMDEISYFWSQISGKKAEILNKNTAKTLVELEDLESNDEFIFRLEVMDKKGLKSADEIKVIIKDEILFSSFNITAPLSVKSNEEFTLDIFANIPLDSLIYNIEAFDFQIINQMQDKIIFKAKEVQNDLESLIKISATDGKTDKSETHVIKILAKESEVPDPNLCANNWEQDKVYLANDKVSHLGYFYKAKWWTKGEKPSLSSKWGVWQKLDKSPCDQGENPNEPNDPDEPTEPPTPPSGNKPSEFVLGTPYKSGDQALKNGTVYQCKEWPNGLWCASNAKAYEPEVGFAWQDAWLKL